MEDVHGSVIGAGGHQRVALVVGHLLDGVLVALDGLVGLGGEVHVEPGEAPVERRADHVVALVFRLMLRGREVKTRQTLEPLAGHWNHFPGRSVITECWYLGSEGT